eukprot:scaffold47123_cov56-Phaeocystis_antarctica.AAC.4
MSGAPAHRTAPHPAHRARSSAGRRGRPWKQAAASSLPPCVHRRSRSNRYRSPPQASRVGSHQSTSHRAARWVSRDPCGRPLPTGLGTTRRGAASSGAAHRPRPQP